ncbi:MAG: T9SS type A sorting domain-containing protein, partial [Bacteroidota bacterium]
YIIGIAGLADITIEVLLGKSRDGEARWENDDQVRIEYSIDNGPFQIAGLFTGNNPAAGVGGELLEDTDQNPGTFGPFGTALTDVFTNFSWTVQGSGTNLEFRVVVLSNGTEEVAFDKICISTALACLNDTTNVSSTTCDPGQVGIVQQTLTNFCGADSIVITTTTLLPSDTTNVASTTCDPGQVGVVQQTLTNQFGCDSIVLTTTTLLPSDTTNVASTTCDPGQVGVVQQTFTNQFGCDSIVLTTTTLLPSDTTNVAETTCDPGQVGVVQQTFTNQFGCDSIVLTTTTLLPSDTTNVAETTCDPGQVGVVQQTFTNQFGCDSIVLTTTTLLPSDTTNVSATTCDPGQVGVVQQTLTNQFGCDSIVLTTTTLLPSDTTNVAETTCDPGQVGVVQQTLTNQFGCDSIVLTTTTLLPSDTTNVAETTCDPGQVGVVQQTLTNQFGCDSIVLTTTTLLPSDTTNVASTTCDPGQVGVVQQTFTNQFGCDSIVLTTTTLLPSDTTNVSATTCDPDLVGVEQQTFTNQFGCDSVVITTTTFETPPDAGDDVTLDLCSGEIIDLDTVVTAPGGSFSIGDSAISNIFNTTGLGGEAYVIEYTVASTNSCPDGVAMICVMINRTPPTPSVSDITVCEDGDTEIIPVLNLPNRRVPFEVIWNFQPPNLSANTNRPALISPANVVLGPGVNSPQFFSGFSGNGLSTTNWAGGPGNFYDFCITPNVGTVDIFAVGSRFRRSNTGPKDLAFLSQENGTGPFQGIFPPFPNDIIATDWKGRLRIGLPFNPLADDANSFCFRITADDATSNAGRFHVDDVIIVGVVNLPPPPITFNFYDADPTAGPANLLAGGVSSYDPGTTAGNTDMIWVTAVLENCESDPVKVTVSNETGPDAGSDNMTTVCEGTVVDLLPLVSAPGGSFEDPGASGGLSGSDFNTSGLPVGDYDIWYIVPTTNSCPNDTAVITVTVEPNIEEICVINTYDTANPDDHVFVFFDFPKAAGGTYLAARFVWDGSPGQLTVNGDGTATITGKVKLKQDNNVTFDVSILLENRMDWPMWSGLGRTYAYKPATQAVASLEHVNWDYYEMSASSSLTACPGSTYDGDVINLTHKPADYSMGFQVGFAANEKDNDKGIAGWFFYSGTLGSVSVSDWGDMNADLDCSFTNCVDCTVDFTTVNSPEICNGAGGGSITMNATGGSGVYDFSEDGGTTWITGTGSNSYSFNNLSGMIELRVRDANDLNCRSDIRFVDLTGPAPDFTTSTVDASCADREDGSIDINVTAGNGPFMYSLNGGAFVGSGNMYTFSGLAADDHTIQVKDANGCISDPKIVTTGTNNPPAFDVSITHESSPGANDGAVTVVVTSGVPSFLFSNDNGATLVPGVGNTHIFTGLTVGFYDLLVEDGNGCQSTRLPAFVSGAGFCPPTDLIDDFFTAHPGNDGKNARFMCEDQSPSLLYELTGLSGGNSFYLDWEVSGFQGKATGDRPTVDGIVPATDGSVGGSTASTTTNGIHTFDANGKVFGLEDNVNSMRRISLAVQPYMVNSAGTVCPANPDTWKVYVYKRAQADLDNAIVPGTAIVINSGDDPTGSISIDQTSNIKEKSNGLLIYDLHIDPNPDITELAAGVDQANVGLSANNYNDNDFEDIDLGLNSLTNTSGGAVTVTVELTPKFDPKHSRAADKDPINNPNGYCNGATQTIDIIVNSVSPRKANNTVLVNGKSVNFRLYPNPADTYFFLQASAVLEQAQKFEITNMLGQTLIHGQIEAGAAREKVEVQNLSAGVYMVKIINEQGPAALIRFEKIH